MALLRVFGSQVPAWQPSRGLPRCQLAGCRTSPTPNPTSASQTAATFWRGSSTTESLGPWLPCQTTRSMWATRTAKFIGATSTGQTTARSGSESLAAPACLPTFAACLSVRPPARAPARPPAWPANAPHAPRRPPVLLHPVCRHSIVTQMNGFFVLPANPRTIYVSRNIDNIFACSIDGSHNGQIVVSNTGYNGPYGKSSQQRFSTITGEGQYLYTT